MNMAIECKEIDDARMECEGLLTNKQYQTNFVYSTGSSASSTYLGYRSLTLL